MNKHSIIFAINDKEKIVLENEAPIEKLSCYCETPIILTQDKHTSLLSIEDIHSNMLAFRDQLTKALHNELKLHKSVAHNIGYAFNQYLEHEYNDDAQNDPNIVYVDRDGVDSWIGDDYQLFGHDLLITWLYNNDKGAIILESTPLYPSAFLATHERNGWHSISHISSE
jgi:hypothetical protein